MSTTPDAALVLFHLARTLDVPETLRAFPGLTEEELAGYIRDAARQVDTGASPVEEGVLSVDGAARGNPGPAGAGMVLKGADGSRHRLGEYLGEATNNVAEYLALIKGMEMALGRGIRYLKVRSDSQLMVRQLNGQYKVKSAHLLNLYFEALKAISSFEKVTFEHVPREENQEADKMANLAIDAKDTVTL